MNAAEIAGMTEAGLSAARLNGLTYSRLLESLDKAQVKLNRKMLSEIAIHDPEGFTAIVAQAKAVLA